MPSAGGMRGTVDSFARRLLWTVERSFEFRARPSYLDYGRESARVDEMCMLASVARVIILLTLKIIVVSAATALCPCCEHIVLKCLRPKSALFCTSRAAFSVLYLTGLLYHCASRAARQPCCASSAGRASTAVHSGPGAPNSAHSPQAGAHLAPWHQMHRERHRPRQQARLCTNTCYRRRDLSCMRCR